MKYKDIFRCLFTQHRCLFAGLVFILATEVAQSFVWQWSVPMGKGRAFLWIPPHCKHVRAFVVGQDNMIEEGILEHPIFRKILAKGNMGEVFVGSPLPLFFASIKMLVNASTT